MPAISVLLDGVLLATVNTDGHDVVSVHVHGTRIDDESAAVEMSAGTYPEHGESSHLIWVSGREVRPGQEVEVRFQPSGDTSHRGKTIDELFPEDTDPEPAEDFFSPDAAMFEQLRARPSRRAGWALRLRSSAGMAFEGRTDTSDHGFGFGLTWNSSRPERAHLSLHAYSLDDLGRRAPMRDWVREHVRAPYVVMLRVDV